VKGILPQKGKHSTKTTPHRAARERRIRVKMRRERRASNEWAASGNSAHATLREIGRTRFFIVPVGMAEQTVGGVVCYGVGRWYGRVRGGGAEGI